MINRINMHNVDPSQKIFRIVDEKGTNASIGESSVGERLASFPLNMLSNYQDHKDLTRRDANEATVPIACNNGVAASVHGCTPALISCWSMLDNSFDPEDCLKNNKFKQDRCGFRQISYLPNESEYQGWPCSQYALIDDSNTTSLYYYNKSTGRFEKILLDQKKINDFKLEFEKLHNIQHLSIEDLNKIKNITGHIHIEKQFIIVSTVEKVLLVFQGIVDLIRTIVFTGLGCDNRLVCNATCGRVTYYPKNGIPEKEWLTKIDPTKYGINKICIEEVFHKPESFSDEKEFRFAMFINDFRLVSESRLFRMDAINFAKTLIYPSIYAKNEHPYIDCIYYLSNDTYSKYVVYQAKCANIQCIDVCSASSSSGLIMLQAAVL